MGFFHGWLLHLASHAHSLEVIANGVGEYSLPSHVHVHSLGKEGGRGRLRRYLQFYVYLLRILPRVDGVFVHMCPEYVVALYPCNIFLRKPVVMWYAHVAVSLVAKWAIGKVKKVLSPSGDSFVVPTEKLIATGHGIDTDLFAPKKKLTTPSTTLRILAVSRISPIKHIEVLLEALNILVHRRKVTNFHVTFAGAPASSQDEMYNARLKKREKEYHLSPFISWIGSVRHADTPELYQNADIFVRMQAGGGFGKTELEAMACGLPTVLCTPVYNKALAEFTDDIYWDANDPAAFAEKLERVIGWSEARRAAFGKHARDLVVREHNLDSLVQRIVTTFKSVAV